MGSSYLVVGVLFPIVWLRLFLQVVCLCGINGIRASVVVKIPIHQTCRKTKEKFLARQKK